MNKIFKAIEFATIAHEGQFRKGTSMPYIMHPLSVALYLQKLGCSEEIVIAGIFHDLLEDTDITEKNILNEYGETVLRIVKGCTDPKELSWRKRKEYVLDKYKTASFDIRIVSLTDKLHNISAIVNDIKNDPEIFISGKFAGYTERYGWYYDELLNVFSKWRNEETFGIVYDEFEKKFAEFKILLNL